jgi:hypothetical protein
MAGCVHSGGAACMLLVAGGDASIMTPGMNGFPFHFDHVSFARRRVF